MINTWQDGTSGGVTAAGRGAEDGGGVCGGDRRTVSAAGAHIQAMDAHPVEDSTTYFPGMGQRFKHKFGRQPEKNQIFSNNKVSWYDIVVQKL